MVISTAKEVMTSVLYVELVLSGLEENPKIRRLHMV
jgi:hypothetical protein